MRREEAIPAIDKAKPRNTYRFVRRFLRLDWENMLFTVVRDEEYGVVHNCLDSAWKQLMASLDAKEGREGVIEYWRAGIEETWDGLYADEGLEYPQLASMYRMHWAGGRLFDYVFYSEEGRYNGEDIKYLFLNGSVFHG